MDPLTHVLLGMLVALVVEPARPRPGFVGRNPRLAAGAVAGVLPDVGWLASLRDPLAPLGDAMAWTHSLLFAPVFALLVAAVFSLMVRRPRDWPVFLAVTGPALLVHLGVDLLTSGGLQPWYPVVATRYAVPLLFPVDLIATLLLLVAAGIAWRRPPLARWAALAAFGTGALYLFAIAQWRDLALSLGERMASERMLEGYSVHAFPQPFSPRNWQVLVAHADAFEIAWVNVAQSAAADPPPGGATASAPILAPLEARRRYSAADAVRWEQSFRFGSDGGRAEFARTAWTRPEFGAFRRFSVYTVLSHVEYRPDAREVCAWFHDARYALPGLAPGYRFGSCQHLDEKTWSVQRAPGPLAVLPFTQGDPR